MSESYSRLQGCFISEGWILKGFDAEDWNNTHTQTMYSLVGVEYKGYLWIGLDGGLENTGEHTKITIANRLEYANWTLSLKKNIFREGVARKEGTPQNSVPPHTPSSVQNYTSLNTYFSVIPRLNGGSDVGGWRGINNKSK